VQRRDRATLVIEAFATDAGARWMADQARALTGRWPALVVLTHFHGDHTGGIAGFAEAGPPAIRATATTRELVEREDAGRDPPPSPPRTALLADVALLPEERETTLDLGGHTPSDVSLELDDPSVVWCGDLVWNRMFPNYRDAIPSRLSRDVRALVRTRATTYVPGHGPLADAPDLDRYIALIDDVEAAARRAIERGISAVDAAKEYRVPAALGEWVMFSPRFYEVAFTAWERELKGS
jgi:glyoxylase-like metal-dependent hydrolase (beta-lactamase superfamily II)